MERQPENPDSSFESNPENQMSRSLKDRVENFIDFFPGGLDFFIFILSCFVSIA